MASSPQCCTDLLETTAGVRQGRSTAGKEMAGKIQRGWPSVLGWTPLWEGDHASGQLEPGTHLSRDMGQRPVSVHLRTGPWPLEFPTADARVVFGDWCSGRPLGPWALLDTTVTGAAVARLCGGCPPGASRPECKAGVFCQRSAIPPRQAAVMGVDDYPAPPTTLGAAAWTCALRPDPVAVAECAGPGVAV